MRDFDYPKSLGIPQLREFLTNPRSLGWIVVLIGLIQALGFPAAYLGSEHDDALYVLASQALREGHYRQWFLPGNLPLTQITPGLPALLTPASFLTPDALPVYSLVLLILLWAADAGVWFWLRRRHSPAASAALAAVILLNPLLLARVGVVMPEIPFLAATLWVLLRWDRPGAAWGNGLLMAFAYLIRPAALPLWGAVGVALAVRRRWGDLARTAAVPLATYALWAYWSRSGGGVQETIELGTRYGGDLWGTAGAAMMHNLREMSASLGMPFLPLGLVHSGAAPAMGGAVLLAAVAGLARRLRRDPADPGALFLGASLLMHLLWPWWYYRYLVPLLPFLVAAVVELRPTRLPRRTGLLLAAGVAAFTWIVQGQAWTRGRLAERTPALAGVYRWMKDNTSPADRFASLLYGRDMLLGERMVQPLSLFGDTDEAERRLEAAGIRYVLWEGRSEDFGLSNLNRERPQDHLARLETWLESPRFTEVYRGEKGERIFQYRKSHLSGENL